LSGAIFIGLNLSAGLKPRHFWILANYLGKFFYVDLTCGREFYLSATVLKCSVIDMPRRQMKYPS